ncbi:MAG TPA: phosphatase PAP2 family protein [Vicinamibacterales bacterium]
MSPTDRFKKHLRSRDRTELRLLVGGLALLVLLLAFARLASVVVEGDTQPFDERILRALREPDDPSTPRGPSWLPGIALDVTALGSGVVIGLAVAAIGGYLLLQGMYRTTLFVVTASAGGWLLNIALKEVFQRARPDVVPHLREVVPLSFPSGHAMTSAAVYLTLGAMLMRISERRATKFYCMAVAMLATFLVGISRVYLGVHYPTDVIAGWLVGLSWALVCWIVERAIERRSGMKREQFHGGHEAA